MSAEDLAPLLDLSVPDRIELVQRLWDSVAQEADSVPISESHLEVIRLRLDAYRRDPGAGSPWPEVRSRIRAQK